MAGHSKWAQIKRQKGIADGKKANVFTKIAKMITIAVKEGGGISDPASNFKLRLAVEKARGANMPKINIERAIDLGSGKLGNAVVEEGLYEGYAPGGNIALLVETLTDNNQRTYSEIRNLFDKSGARLVQPGAVSFMFKVVGVIKLKMVDNPDDLILQIMEIEGVEDVVSEDGVITIYTELSKLKDVKEKIDIFKWEIEEAHKGYKSNISVETGDDELEKLWTFVDKLYDHDDVQRVFTVID